MFARLQIPQRVSFGGIDLQLIRFVLAHQRIHQLRRVIKVDILIDQAMDDQ